jgi:hypothetical protein
MRSTILLSVASLAGVCLVSSGYGCGSSNSNSPGDGGTGGETSSGGSSGGSSGSSSGGLPTGDDGGGDTGSETGMPCTSMPKGTQVLASATASIQSVTSDGQVIYYDAPSLTLSAVAVTGGSPTSLGTFNSASGALFTAGKVAAFFTGLTQTTAPAYGPLTVYTAAGGPKKVSTSSYYGAPGNGAFDISADGSFVLYTDNATATSADIYVAGTDGSHATKLVSGASWGQFCSPVLRFIGDYAVVGYCTAQPDAGTSPVATIAAYSAAPMWATVQPVANADAFPVFSGNSQGTMVSFVNASGMYLETLGGTTPTPTLVDANGIGGLFTHDGTSVLFFDQSRNLWRSPVATPAPVEVAAGPWIGTLALSSDDKWLELAKAQDSSTGWTDMYLVSTTPVAGDAGGSVTTLTSMTNGANFFDAFTADNSQALFFTPIDTNGVAPFLHLPLPPTGAPATVSMTGWVEFPTTGTKVVYSDNWAMGCSGGCADIKGVDVATTAAPTTLVTKADANFFVTADKKTVVYSWNACTGVTGGIYSIPAP